MIKKTISKYFSEMAEKTHKVKPRDKAFYRRMQRKSVAKRKANKKLSTK